MIVPCLSNVWFDNSSKIYDRIKSPQTAPSISFKHLFLNFTIFLPFFIKFTIPYGAMNSNIRIKNFSNTSIMALNFPLKIYPQIAVKPTIIVIAVSIFLFVRKSIITFIKN